MKNNQARNSLNITNKTKPEKKPTKYSLVYTIHPVFFSDGHFG